MHRSSIAGSPVAIRTGTPADNSADMVSKNRSSRGERHRSAKPTPDQVEEIRRRCRAEALTQRGAGRRVRRRPRLPSSTVALILTKKVEGVSMRRIATQLDEETVPASGGGSWD